MKQVTGLYNPKVETWKYAAHSLWNVNFILDKGRAEQRINRLFTAC
jgi:hypothetical protein